MVKVEVIKASEEAVNRGKDRNIKGSGLNLVRKHVDKNLGVAGNRRLAC
jgi:hypothetical protein